LSIIDLLGKKGAELALETSSQNKIKNYQGQEISIYELNLVDKYEKKYGPYIKRRSEPSPIYNCHGMTFASKRTGIDEPSEIYKIIKDDKYIEIIKEEVLPGDIILYFDEEGDIEHSGIVVRAPRQDSLWIPMIFSKWGKYAEVIHLANQCPYNFSRAKYYRSEL